MWLYLIPSPQLKLSYANEYTCHEVMLLNDTQIAHILDFHPYHRETVILNKFDKIHDEKYRFC